MDRRHFLELAGLTFGGFALIYANHVDNIWAGEAFPAQKITWIVPVKPAGGFDLIARCTSPYLGKYLKGYSKGAKAVDVVVKNVAEAGGARAYSNIFHAKPDGYTIGDFNTAFVAEKLLSKPDFDYSKFTFLVRTGVSCRVIVVRKDGFKNWQEMLKVGKEKEVKWAIGNFSGGSHVGGILMKEVGKIPARLINFPGTAENANALLRGDVQMATVTEESAKAMIDSGEIRILAVLSESSSNPSIPSLSTLGLSELIEPLKLHRMLIGPPDLPGEITSILISCFMRVFSDKEFLAQSKRLDFDPDPLYGADAERLAKSIIRYYEEKVPILKKYLS